MCLYVRSVQVQVSRTCGNEPHLSQSTIKAGLVQMRASRTRGKTPFTLSIQVPKQTRAYVPVC